MGVSALADRERLLTALTRLADSRAPEARLVLQSGPVYLVWVARRGASGLEQEGVPSAALPPTHKLSSERAKILRDLGFHKRGGGQRVWKRGLEARDRHSLARNVDETLDVLARVYATGEGFELELVEDRAEHPRNPELVEAMRLVSRGFDEAKRRAMYSAMLNATYLVPLALELDDDAEGSEAFHDFETHDSGRPTLGAFTDWDSLRMWEPRGHAYWSIHGSELFEMAHERRPISMRINPNGDVGGELYGHEVEMLVRAVETFRRRNSH